MGGFLMAGDHVSLPEKVMAILQRGGGCGAGRFSVTDHRLMADPPFHRDNDGNRVRAQSTQLRPLTGSRDGSPIRQA